MNLIELNKFEINKNKKNLLFFIKIFLNILTLILILIFFSKKFFFKKILLTKFNKILIL